MMCNHKLRLTPKDKDFLKTNGIAPYECVKCEQEVRMSPKLKVEKKKE